MYLKFLLCFSIQGTGKSRKKKKSKALVSIWGLPLTNHPLGVSMWSLCFITRNQNNGTYASEQNGGHNIE